MTSRFTPTHALIQQVYAALQQNQSVDDPAIIEIVGHATLTQCNEGLDEAARALVIHAVPPSSDGPKGLRDPAAVWRWKEVMRVLGQHGACLPPDHASLPDAVAARCIPSILVFLAWAGCDPILPLADGSTPFERAMAYPNPTKNTPLREWCNVGVPLNDPVWRDRAAGWLVSSCSRRNLPHALASLRDLGWVNWSTPTPQGEVGAVFLSGLSKMDIRDDADRAWRAAWSNRVNDELGRCRLVQKLERIKTPSVAVRCRPRL